MPSLAFQHDAMADTPILPTADITTSYYLRLRVADKLGVLADVTHILADESISIDAMLQKEPAESKNRIHIIILTHQTQEKNVEAAIKRVDTLPTVVAGLAHGNNRGIVAISILDKIRTTFKSRLTSTLYFICSFRNI